MEEHKLDLDMSINMLNFQLHMKFQIM